MRVLLKALVFLILVGVVGLVGFAIFSDLPPHEREIVVPVEPR